MSEKLCIDSPMELEWFREVLAESKAFLETLPEYAQPSWYRASLEDL